MRNFLLIAFAVFFGSRLYAQLPDGSTAPDWTLTDINGNSHHLYAYLDSGYTVFIDFSATWCGPCWNYHNSGNLENLYLQYGPGGTNEVRVFFIEGDPNTGLDCLYGQPSCPSSQGNWVDGTPYPIINSSSQNGPYNIGYWPTIYGICSNHLVYEVGQQSTAGLYAWHQQTCPSAPSMTITVNSVQNLNCFESGDGSIDIDVSGGSGSFSYNWSNGAQTQDLSNIPAGTYFVTVTDNQTGSTQVSDPIEVLQPDQLILTQTFYQPVTCQGGGSDGAVGYVASGGTPTYFFNWSNGAVTQAITGLVPGVYTLTVTDANGCTADDAVVFLEPDYPVAVVNQNPPVLTCDNDIIMLDGTGSSTGTTITYQWTTTDGNIISGANTLTPSVSAAGTYTLTVTNNSNGCSASASVTVTSNISYPTISAQGGTITCNNPSVTLSASTDASSPSFSWAGPGGFTSTQSNPVVTVAGPYDVTVTDGISGCQGTATAMVISDLDEPQVTISGNGVLTCNNASTTLTAASPNAPNATFSWTGPNGFSATGAAVTVNMEGTYTVTATDPVNGCQGTATFTVTSNIDVPDVTVSADGELTCTNTSVQLSATANNAPNATFLWAGPNGFSATGAVITVSVAGIYTVTVANPDNGCQVMDTITVNSNTNLPNVSVSADGELTCTNTSVQLTATSGNTPNATFTWNGPNNFNASGAVVNVTTAGSYTVFVTDPVNGCENEAGVTVNSNTFTPTVTINASGNLTCTTTSVTVEAVTNSNQATYQWAGPGGFTSTNSSISASVSGSYSVTVTDVSSGCTNTAETYVSQIDPPVISCATVSDVTTSGGADGVGSVTVTGGSPAYTVSLSNGMSQSIPASGGIATFTGLSAGTYSAVVVDAAGCEVICSFTISEPGCNLSLSANTTPETCPDANDGTITVTASGANGSVTYSWSNGMSGGAISGLDAGSYTVTATDAAGCMASLTVTVEGNDFATPVFDDFPSFCASDDPYQMPSVSNNGITGSWSINPFNPSGGTQQNTFTPAPDECATPVTITMTVNPLPDVTIAQYDPVCSNANPFSLSATPAGGSFSGPGVSGGQFNPASVDIGNYTVTYTYTDPVTGCVNSASTTISIINCDCQNPPTVDAGNGIDICAGDIAQLSGTIGGGATMATWSGGTGTFDPNNTTLNASYTPSANEVANGSVVLVLTTDDPDGNGPCTAAIDEVEITIHSLPDVYAGGALDTQCVDGPPVPLIFATPAGGVWSGPGVSGDAFDPEGAGVGTHTLTYTYTDAFGCSGEDQLTVVVIDCSSSDCQNPPTVDAGQDQWACANNPTFPLAATMGGSATSITWTGGLGTYIPGNQTPNAVYTASPTEIAAGEVILTITTNDPDGNGPCVAAVDEVTLHINPVPDVDPGSYDEVCADADPIQLVGTPAGGTWSGPGVTGNTFDPVAAGGVGEYELTYTVVSPLACVGTATVTIVVVDCADCANPPTASAGVDVTICADSEVQLAGVIGGGASSATWSGGNGTFTPDANALNAVYLPSVDEVQAGSVTLTLTTDDPDGNGPCEAASSSMTITIENPDFNVEVSGQLCCNNDTVIISATAGCDSVKFILTAPDGTTTSYPLNLAAPVTEPGTYQVFATCPSGCVADAEVVVEECEPISGVTVEVTPDDGSGGAAQVTIVTGGTAPYSYNWYDQDGNLVGSGEVIDNLEAGTYHLVVTDANGCQFEQEVQIIVGVNEPDWAVGLRIYPNPADAVFTVELTRQLAATVEVRNALGQVLLTRDMPYGKITLHLDDMPDGVYFIKLQVGTTTVFRKLNVIH